MRKLNHIFLACCLLLAGMATSISMQAQDKTPITVDGCRPLLAPDCVIDDIIDEVGVLSDKHDTYSNLLDADLTNGTTINTVLADIGLGYKPIVSIRDIKNVYKGGNGMKAGFMVADSKVSLLSLDLLKTFVISLYNDNQLVYTAPINDLDGTLLNLGLVDFGEKGGKMEFSISVPEKDKDGKELIFDEIALGTTGVNLDVLKTLSFYYGFVGESRTEINWANFGTELTSSPDIPLIGIPQNYLVDGNSDTYQSWSLIGGLLGKSCYIKTNGIVPQLQQKEIGFVYSAHDLISLSVLPTVTITFIKSGSGLLPNDETDEHTVEAQLLGASVLSGQQIIYSAAPTVGFEWDKVEISFGALKVEAGVSHLHYAFVRDIQIPDEAKKHRLNLSADALLCENETEYTLTSDVNVTWSLKQVLDLDGKTDKTEDYKSGVTIDPTTLTKSAKVTFATPAGAEIYIFEAKDEDGCTGTVTLTRGKTQEMEDASANWLYGTLLSEKRDQVHLENPKGGALIAIDNLESSENILDGNPDTYASYAKGLQLASHTGIVSVKKDEGSFDENTKVVGFVAETPNSLLGADVLKFYNIVLYNKGEQVYSSVTGMNNSVQAALLGAPGSAKVRYAIEVPQEYIGKFDEFTLFTSGVLNLDLTGKSLKIYGAFVSDQASWIQANDPLNHIGVTALTSQNTGATFNYSKTGNAGLVQAVTVLSGLGYLLDGTTLTDEGKGATSYSVANVLGSTDITVKAGRKFSGNRWVGFVIKVPTGIGDVDLLSEMEILAYHDGALVGDNEQGTFLTANLIGWGDYAYISCYTSQPFDEVTFRNRKLVEALKDIQYLGFYTYADNDGDGIPDEEDPDFCEIPMEVELTSQYGNDMNGLCESGSEMLSAKITAPNAAGIYYQLSNVDTEEVIDKGMLTESDGGVFTHSIDLAGLGLTWGRYIWQVSVANQPLVTPVSKNFVIHAAQTTWMPVGTSSDWNDWKNWSSGVPVIGCTDVIIPGQCTVFPVLRPYYEYAWGEKPLDFNSCEGIHFSPGAEALGTQYLEYKKAWVELELSLGRYYMLSAPLKGMYTGDFFVSDGMNGIQNNPYFTDLNEESAPAGRFAPRVLQRLWDKVAPVVNPMEQIDGETDAENAEGSMVQLDEAQWTQPFNALEQEYTQGLGFSLKAENENVWGTKVRFRFPKEHTRYYYYNENGIRTDLYEDVERANTGRLFTDDFSEPLVLNLTSNSESDVFLVGNPFMAHINIERFLTENANITSLKVYDGDAANSLILADGKLLTNGTDEWTAIAPMQSFFVTVEEPQNALSVVFSEEMLETVGNGNQLLRVAARERLEPENGLMITASVDSMNAQARVLFREHASSDFVPTEDASLLIDGDIKPRVAVYTLAGQRATDIQQLPETDRIPLGVCTRRAETLTLKLHSNGAGKWHLYDAMTRRLYRNIESTEVQIDQVESNAGRFVLVRDGSELSLPLTDSGVMVTRNGNKTLRLISTDQVPLCSCQVYAADGRMVAQWSGETVQVDQLQAAEGINMVSVTKKDGTVCSQKIICY